MPSQFATDAADKARIAAARKAQDYDPDPPRCFTCVYFYRGPMNPVRKMKRGQKGPNTIEMCRFGNIPVTYKGVCDEWRNKAGERVKQEEIE